MRKLASIQKIEEVRSIPGADSICAYRVNDWWVVDTIGKYDVDSLVIYLEVDAWVPHELAPFLSKGQHPRVYNGVEGERLKTVKLRGQISQGLLLPTTILDEKGLWPLAGNPVGHELTKQLGIQKWEPPIPLQLQGTMKGQFPSYIPKTDQERCQNLRKEIFEEHAGESYEVTEKLEGTSYTFFIRDGVFNVCSRNINLKETEGNTFWEVARKYNIEETLYKFSCKGLAFQAEIVGPSIQNNIYNLRDIKFYVFDIYDIESGVYFGSEKRQDLCEELGFDHVPVLEFIQINNKSIEDIVSMADGFSQLNNKILREGIVFKSLCGSFHFKSVSNKYLMKTNL